jgi:hypothetical protein
MELFPRHVANRRRVAEPQRISRLCKLSQRHKKATEGEQYAGGITAMTPGVQQDYYRKVDAAIERAHDILDRHHVPSQKFRVHIRSLGLSNPAEQHALTISTADGSMWVTEKTFPFRCLEDIDPFGSDAFATIVSERLAELLRKMKSAGRRL